ncbi:uncharacterized protein LOC131299175 [Rhododendron vialii]|uniref:uncharacterized protein LOC131299175 n=1 Tax=Rhododendron vialii TaxID=182163 RepID=UPI00265D989C|nr:uncharacterized protein LOC131299175 [Rhododendron vialii]
MSEYGEGSRIQVPIIHDHSLKELLQVRARGYGKRLRGGKEKAAKKDWRCNGCGLTGQSHDKRNCPKLLSTSSQNSRMNDDNDIDINYAMPMIVSVYYKMLQIFLAPLFPMGFCGTSHIYTFGLQDELVLLFGTALWNCLVGFFFSFGDLLSVLLEAELVACLEDLICGCCSLFGTAVHRF